MKDCLGCKLVNQEYPVHVVYEDEHVICFLDYDPFNDGHTLVLPKKHIAEVTDFDVETAAAVMNASIRISKAIQSLYKPDGITICQNGGVFNELTHYHMHIVPRYENQPFGDFYNEEAEGNDVNKDFSSVRKMLEGAIGNMCV